MAGGRARGVDRRGAVARRAALPGCERTLWRVVCRDGLPVDLRRTVDRPRLRRRAEREHVPTLLDMGPLDGVAVPEGRGVRLAAAHDRLCSAGVSHPAGGPLTTGRAGSVARLAALAARSPPDP